MRVLKKRLLFLTFLTVLAVLASQNASALLDSGTVNYDTGSLKGQISFAVFESRAEFETNWSGAGLSAPGTGKYIYAYLITNGAGSSDVSYFALFGLNNANTSGITYGDRGVAGNVKPADAYIDEDESKGVWEWKDENGFNFIKASESSWLLYFSSNQGPVKGNYEIRGPESSNELPIPGEVPEPSMIALTGVGGGLLLRRRKLNQGLKS